MDVEDLLTILLKDKEFYENSGGGITLSGGECLLHADFCAKLLKRLKECGIHTAVDTCGFVPKNSLDKVLPFTDLFLYDVKAFHRATHEKCTGIDNELILDNLVYLDSKGAKTEIRIPVVPNFNDDEIELIGEFLSKLKNTTKIRLLSYHNYSTSKYESLDFENTLPQRTPTQKEMEHFAQKLRSLNLKVVF
jgi:pyruvate formate lyase activating enzyme